mgnify:CR=1 FL=1
MSERNLIESIVNEDVASLEEKIDAILRAKIDEALFGDEDEEEIEESEQIDEISKDTVSNYVVKSAADLHRQRQNFNDAQKKRFKTKFASQLVPDYGEKPEDFKERQDNVTRRRARLTKEIGDADRKMSNRLSGIHMAGKRLAKEDVDQIAKKVSATYKKKLKDEDYLD